MKRPEGYSPETLPIQAPVDLYAVERTLEVSMAFHPEHFASMLEAIMETERPFQDEILWQIAHNSLLKYYPSQHMPSVFERLIGSVSMYSIENTLCVAEALGEEGVAQVLRQHVVKEQKHMRERIYRAIGAEEAQRKARKI